MDVSRIIKKLRADAEAEANAIVSEARRGAQRLREVCAADIAREEEGALLAAKEEAEELALRLRRMDDLEERKRTLAAKRDLLDEAFRQALSELEGIPAANARRYFMRKLTQLAQGGETVLPGERNSHWLDDAFVREASDALRAAGRNEALCLSEERVSGMGFALVLGGTRMECTFEALLAAQRLALEAEAAAVLFV